MYFTSSDYDKAKKIIDNMSEIGIGLWVENGKLKFRAPENLMSKGVLEEIKLNKSIIMNYFTYIDSNNSDAFPLTSIQKAYLMGRNEEYELGGISTNYYFELEFKKINIEKFESAVNKVISNSDALRTIILPNGFQKLINEVPYYKISYWDLDKIDIINKRQQWSQHMYELGKWPMFDIRYTRKDKGCTYMHFTFDCMLIDAGSVNVFLEKVFHIYQDKEVSWSKYTFKDYCKEQDEYRSKFNLKNAESYWEEIVKTLPTYPKLRFKQELEEIKKPKFTRLSYLFTQEETKQLYKKSMKYRVTIAAVICTIYMKVLCKYSENKNLTLNMPVFNRLPINEDVFKLIGDFTNIALVSYFCNNESFIMDVRKTQRQFLNLVKYKEYDGIEVVRKLSKDNRKKALMPVVFTGVFNGIRANNKYLMEDVTQTYAISQTPQVVLDYQATDFTGELSVNWDYVTEAFEKSYIQKMFNDNVEFIKSMIFLDDWNLE